MQLVWPCRWRWLHLAVWFSFPPYVPVQPVAAVFPAVPLAAFQVLGDMKILSLCDTVRESFHILYVKVRMLNWVVIGYGVCEHPVDQEWFSIFTTTSSFSFSGRLMSCRFHLLLWRSPSSVFSFSYFMDLSSFSTLSSVSLAWNQTLRISSLTCLMSAGFLFIRCSKIEKRLFSWWMALTTSAVVLFLLTHRFLEFGLLDGVSRRVEHKLEKVSLCVPLGGSLCCLGSSVKCCR